MKKLWKECVIAYLEKVYGKPLTELANALMTEGVLTPRFRQKGHILVEPDSRVSEAWYLKSGMAKLYAIDMETGLEKIYFIWEAESIVVLFKSFIEGMPNTEFYIQLMTDCELVSITNFSMDGIYEEHTVAHILTRKIMILKTERRMLHTSILSMIDKKRRYCELKRKFPGLFIDGFCQLTNAEICAFINVTGSTIREAKKICPDG